MGLDSDEDVFEVGERVDALQPACGHDGLEDGEVLAPGSAQSRTIVR